MTLTKQDRVLIVLAVIFSAAGTAGFAIDWWRRKPTDFAALIWPLGWLYSFLGSHWIIERYRRRCDRLHERCEVLLGLLAMAAKLRGEDS